MDKLNAFYQDKAMMEAVYTHVGEHLKQIALIKVFSGKETTAIPEAKLILDEAFDSLEDLYGTKKTKKQPSSR